MTEAPGIYGQVPTDGKPCNAQRARQGLRPLCYARPDFPELREVHDGYTTDGRLRFALVPWRGTFDCQAWTVRAADPRAPGDVGEDPGADSIPAREAWRCLGCPHLPQSDPRVLARAQASEVPP